jgi:hypothetical protein
MPGRHSARSVVVPFPAHQVLDYLGGLYLLQAGTKVHGRATAVFFVAGLVVLLAATLSGKPLGGGRLARPLHRVVDIAIIVGLAAAPFVFGLTGETEAVVRLEGLAAIFVALAWFTNYARPRPRGQGQTAQTARALKEHGPRVAGQLIGRRLANKRRPPGPT